MPDNGEIQLLQPAVTAETSAQRPIAETTAEGAIGGHTDVSAGSVLKVLAQDNPHANPAENTATENQETTQPTELLQPREYPLLAQGLKARTLQALRQMQSKVEADPTIHQQLQDTITAITQVDASHVGNRNTLSAFIGSLTVNTQNDAIRSAITTIATSTQALATDNQTSQTIGLACQHLHLVSPHSVVDVLNGLEGTFTQRAQAAVQQAARELYHQNRALSPEQERMITANVLEPYLSRIEGRHILSPTDLQELINLAENTAISNPHALEKAKKNESLAQIKAAIGQSVQEYQVYLSGSEQTTSWNNTGTEAMAGAITQAIETESDIEMDTELKQTEHKRRIQKIKTTSMLVAVLLGMLIYSSMPKGEQP